MGIFSSIGTAVGTYFGGSVGGAVGGAIGGAIDGDSSGSNASQSKVLSKKAIEYLEKQGKTAEEIKEIAGDVGAYEDVFAGYSDEIYEYKGDYAQYGAEYGGYEDTYTDQAVTFSGLGDQSAGKSGDMWDRYTEKFQPVQDMAIDEVMKGPQTEEARARASADTAQAFDVRRDAFGRSQGRMGIDPNSGNAIAAAGDLSRDEAIATVGARNAAARDEDDKHWAKLLSVNKMGAALPGQADQALRTAGSMYGSDVDTTRIAQDALGNQVDMTGKEIGVIGASLEADQAAQGAIKDEANILNTAATQEGKVATGYGAAAGTATQGAIADSEAQGQTSAIISDFITGQMGGSSPSPNMADDWTDNQGYGVG